MFGIVLPLPCMPQSQPLARDLHHRLQSAAVGGCLEGLGHLIERETVANQRRDAHDAILDELERCREVVRVKSWLPVKRIWR